MKYIVLSFDDARKDFFTRAFPILKKYGLPGVLNVITAFVGKRASELDSFTADCMSWEEIITCAHSGIEIANHSANHTNALDDILHGAKQIRTQLNTEETIGFASPHSQVWKENFQAYKPLLETGDAAYIRSGNQLKRDGLFHAFLYFAYKYSGLPTVFHWYNRRNIFALDQPQDFLFPSVTCNRDNTVKQIIHLIDKMPQDSACILMFHSILAKDDDDYGTEKWSNSVEDFDALCRYLSNARDVSVITHKQLCSFMK